MRIPIVLGLRFDTLNQNLGLTIAPVPYMWSAVETAATVVCVNIGARETGTASRGFLPAWQPARRGAGKLERSLTPALRARTVSFRRGGSSLMSNQRWKWRSRPPFPVSRPGSLRRHGAEPPPRRGRLRETDPGQPGRPRPEAPGRRRAPRALRHLPVRRSSLRLPPGRRKSVHGIGLRTGPQRQLLFKVLRGNPGRRPLGLYLPRLESLGPRFLRLRWRWV